MAQMYLFTKYYSHPELTISNSFLRLCSPQGYTGEYRGEYGGVAEGEPRFTSLNLFPSHKELSSLVVFLKY